MNSENEVPETENADEELDSAESSDDTLEVSLDDDNIGDLSVEINVEELVAKLEATDADDAEQRRKIKNRLEEIQEEKSSELDSTYNFNLDDDL